MPADPITSAIGLGVGIIGGIGKIFGNAKANRQLKALQAQDPNYATSAAGIANQNLASNRLGYAQSILNSKMPGSEAIDRSIYAGYGNQQGNIARNASSGEQALALGAANLGQANDSFMREGQNQADWMRGNQQLLQGAQEGMINQNNQVFNDETRRFGDKAQIQGAINANRQNSWGSIENAGFGLASFGMNGGFKGMFGGGGGGENSSINPYTKTVGNIPNQGLGIPNMYNG